MPPASLSKVNCQIMILDHMNLMMKLGSALTDLHPVHRMMPQRLPLELSPEFCQGLNNLYLDTDEGQLDILSDVTGLGPYRVVLQQSVTVELEQRRIRILSLEALIQAKKSEHRPRVKQAVLQLRALLTFD